MSTVVQRRYVLESAELGPLESVGSAIEKEAVVADEAHPWDRAHSLLQEAPAFGLESLPGDAYVEPDIVQVFPTPDASALEGVSSRSASGLHTFWPPLDEEYRFGWHLEESYSGLRAAREHVGEPPDDGRVRIGILDTGFDPEHVTCPRFVNRDRARNLTDSGQENDAVDRVEKGFLHAPGHGTATIGLLAGARVSHADLPGGEDWLGGAPWADVVPIRIADSVVHFSSDAMAKGIEYATSIGCHVVSISMGGVPNRRWVKAVNRAYEAGVTIVAAAGNRYGPSPPPSQVYPARFHRVIAACGATHARDPYFRSGVHLNMQGCFGPPKRMTSAIAAFTPNVPWAVRGGRDRIEFDGGGTSAATPQIAAAAALWIQQHAMDRPADWRRVEAVRNALFGAADRDVADVDKYFGAGLLRARKALDVGWTEDVDASPKARVRFPWFRVVTGLESVGSDAMLETEALQLYLQSTELQELTGGADPDDDLDEATIRKLATAMRHNGQVSRTLSRHLERVE
ncbi:MAG: S8/S53 family peptidase [bacterium]|nr:S8/S53 family peptidase [bacterium]